MLTLLFVIINLQQDIIGDWAVPGECNLRRLTFTDDMKVQIKSNINDKWTVTYNGVYAVEGDIVQGGLPNACLDFAFQITDIDDTHFDYCNLEIPNPVWDCSPMHYEKCK